MLGAVIRAWLARQEETAGKKLVVVSLMPCTAKKGEILRPESRTGGVQDIDYSLTTEELLSMLEQAGLTADQCPCEEADKPFCSGSGGGTLFGVSGGVTEAVLRHLFPETDPDRIAESGVRGSDGVKEIRIAHQDRTICAAIVSGLANANALLQRVEAGEAQYDLIEVMACPGGCIMGGGQPVDSYRINRNRDDRSSGLYHTDAHISTRNSQDNTQLQRVWDQLIRGCEHELLHRNTVRHS